MADDTFAEDVIGQAMVAFGSGAGGMRVSRKTIAAMRAHYSKKLAEHPEIPADWGKEGVQALERITATGRLAASLATQAGETVVQPSHFESAAAAVEARSDTPYCG